MGTHHIGRGKFNHVPNDPSKITHSQLTHTHTSYSLTFSQSHTHFIHLHCVAIPVAVQQQRIRKSLEVRHNQFHLLPSSNEQTKEKQSAP